MPSIVSIAEFLFRFKGHHVVDTQQISQEQPQRLIVEGRVTHFTREESEARLRGIVQALCH